MSVTTPATGSRPPFPPRTRARVRGRLGPAAVLVLSAAAAVAPGILGGRAAAQALGSGGDEGVPLRFWLRDGSFVRGVPVAWSEETLQLRLVEGAEPATRDVPLRRVLSAHGAPPAMPTDAETVEVALAGPGERLVGQLLAGDASGETFVVQSPALGRLPIFVDRLRTIRFLARCGEAGVADFAVPPGDDAEALFRPLRNGPGFQSFVGAIYRFEADQVRFARGSDDDAVRGYAYDELAAISLRDGFPPDEPGPWELLTRFGDQLRVVVEGLERGRLKLVFGPTRLEVALADVACLTFVGAEDRIPLSALDPVEVEERGWFDATRPLMAMQRRRAVGAKGGRVMVADGAAWLEGLGVHSRSRLVYRVPDGATHFVARAAVDDAVTRLGVRADVELTVRVSPPDGGAARLVLDAVRLRSGDAPVAVGPVEVREGGTVELLVDFGEGLALGDRVDWLGAQFLVD